MKHVRKILASREIWRLAFATLGATRSQTLTLLVVGLILPQEALSLWVDLHSGSVVSDLRAAFTAKPGSAGSFTQLLAPAFTYVSHVSLCMILVFLVLTSTYLALVQTAIDHHRGLQPRGAGPAWMAGLRRAAPGVMILMLVSVILVTVGQVLIAPAILAAVLVLVVPIIYLAESRGALRALWAALTLKYAKGSAYSSWSVMFHLLSLGALLYAALAGEGLLCELLLDADERFNLPRTFWTEAFSHAAFGPAYLSVSVLESILTMGVIAMVPALTAAVYFTVVSPRPLGQA